MDKVVVLDFGGQYAHLIANRVRRLGVYCEIKMPETSLAELRKYKGIIFSGGPQSVYDKNAPTVDPEIFKLGMPILGICYGHQLIVHILGGEVESGKVKEYGAAELHVTKKEGPFRGFRFAKTPVWMSHGDEVKKLPSGFEELGFTENSRNAAIGDFKRRIFGVQFHVEVAHTKRGMKMLKNFLDLCGCKKEWSMAEFLKRELEIMKEKTGDRKVFFLVSGGVDSMVAFTLMNRALGQKRAYGLFVNTGLMRKNEGREVAASLKKLGFQNFHTVNASKKFLSALKDATDPEKKRKIIGDLFLEIQREAVRKLKLNPAEWLLGQGTIYPDTIESGGTKHAAKIKTHHNRVPEIQAMMAKGLVIEPLKELYKDEVREVGIRLGLAENLVWRHPFPGPGLGVRILCLQKPFPLPSSAKVEKTIQEFSEKFFKIREGIMTRIPPIRSVGVQGDGRTYRHPLILFGKCRDWKKLENFSTAITNHFPEVNRVCLALFPETAEKISAHPAFLSPQRIHLLQKADDIVQKFIAAEKISRKIWQFPVVLIPVSFDGKKGETIVLRPVISQEAMTANFYPMNWKLLQQLAKKLTSLSGVSGVLYDITHKPPGTIEWE